MDWLCRIDFIIPFVSQGLLNIFCFFLDASFKGRPINGRVSMVLMDEEIISNISSKTLFTLLMFNSGKS